MALQKNTMESKRGGVKNLQLKDKLAMDIMLGKSSFSAKTVLRLTAC